MLPLHHPRLVQRYQPKGDVTAVYRQGFVGLFRLAAFIAPPSSCGRIAALLIAWLPAMGSLIKKRRKRMRKKKHKKLLKKTRWARRQQGK